MKYDKKIQIFTTLTDYILFIELYAVMLTHNPVVVFIICITYLRIHVTAQSLMNRVI